MKGIIAVCLYLGFVPGSPNIDCAQVLSLPIESWEDCIRRLGVAAAYDDWVRHHLDEIIARQCSEN